METDEELDLVDKHDRVIGKVYRSQYNDLIEQKLGYIQAVKLFIQNDAEKLWVPTRTSHKKIAPNGLDYSMGGHVSAGETYITSALREIKEELNLELLEDNLKFIKKFSPTKLPYFRVL